MDVPASPDNTNKGHEDPADSDLRKPDVKRPKLRLQLKTGHDCIFTKELPEHLQVECSVCLCVLDDPHMIDCKCGASFCQPCIQPALTEMRPCPLCNSPFNSSFPDRRLQRTLNSLQVYCSFKEAGCEWVGELGALSEHLNIVESSDGYKSLGCAFVHLQCCYCKEGFQRQFLIDHENSKCLKRPFSCDCCNEYTSTFEDVTNTHINVCPCWLVACPNECGISLQRQKIDEHLATNCPLQIVGCSFSYAGCEEKFPRKDMPAHISDSLAVHMSLQAVCHQKELEKLQLQIQKLENEVKTKSEELKSVLVHLRVMPINVIMNGFTLKKRERKRWMSKPFYTHPRGYKMTLCVTSNGDGVAEGTHVSVFIYIMQGEFDSELEWPFRGAISIQLLDQEGDGQHFTKTVKFDDAPEAYNHRITKGDYDSGWGFSRFISHADLTRYLKYDMLTFEVANVE